MEWHEIYGRLGSEWDDGPAWDALERRLWAWALPELWARGRGVVDAVVADTCAAVVDGLAGAYGGETFAGFVRGHYRDARRRALREGRRRHTAAQRRGPRPTLPSGGNRKSMSTWWWMRMPHGLAPSGRRPDWIGAGEGGPDDVPLARWARLWAATAHAAVAHPLDPGALGEYALLRHRRGAASAAKALPGVAAHLATGCPRCYADLRELLAFAAEEAGRPLGAPQGAPPDAAEGGLRRLIATRITPRRERLAFPTAVRGASGPARDVPAVIYQTDEATVVLRVNRETRGDAVSLRGFVLPHGPESAAHWGGEVRLLEVAAPRPGDGGGYVERIDERGGFVLEDVAPGAYRLELWSARGVIVLNDLDLGSSPPVCLFKCGRRARSL